MIRRPEFLMMRRPCAALRRPENKARSACILLLPLNYLKHQHQNNYYKLCFTVKQPLIHETEGLFPVKIEKNKRFVLLYTFYEIKKNSVKNAVLSFVLPK
jgi:hypothetical protein